MRQKLQLFSVAAIVALVISAACQPLVAPEVGTSEEPAAEAEQDEQQAEPPHWGYEGEEGPENWGGLSADYALCGTGQAQSPINLMDAADADLPDIVFDYQPSALDIVNNGHTVQVNIDPGSTIEVDGVTYALQQFHFHTASEHTMDGDHFPLEMHLVHQSDDGVLAVVGVMAESGSDNPAFAPVWDNLPTEAGAEVQVEGVTINAADLLPEDQVYFGYDGSLTTPPCSEDVKWHVLTTPIQLSEEQISAIHAILHDNFRPVQPLNGRPLAVDTTP